MEGINADDPQATVEADYFKALRQGDLLLLGEGSEKFVIVSQSCDVVLTKRETILIAPVVELPEGNERRTSLSRENARFVPFEVADQTVFADLARIEYRAKSDVSGAPTESGIDRSDDKAVREFALSAGRWFSRYAFPDEVHHWLRPLQELIRERHDSESSPLGKLFRRIAEVRVEADSWSSLTRQITIHVIVKAGVLPLASEAGPVDTSPEQTTRISPADLATMILAETDGDRVAVLWERFAWSLADLCRPKGAAASDPAIMGAVSEVSAQLYSDDEFPLSKVRKSEQLDLEFLSDPQPLRP